MFVFPAFDDNYKTRKRSFKCCQNCRVKKVKCEISSTESELCSNCRKHKWKCDLNIPGKPSVDNDRLNEKIGANNTIEGQNRSEFLEERNLSTRYKTDSITPNITPQYLKDKFNFNTSGGDYKSLYQYLFHSHPKAVIGNKMEDQSVWHESGVYIDDKSKPYINGQQDSTHKERPIKPGFRLRNRKTYDLLLSIDAFTLSTNQYPFSDLQIKELLRLYFYKINSILPIVEEKNFWASFDRNEAPTIIVYAIILAILRDKLAEPILRAVFSKGHGQTCENYTETEFIENLVEFLTDLEYKIRQVTLILPQLGDIDKITLLVELLLLTLHHNFDRLGNEQSSHDLTDAINLAVSSGIHMKRPSSKSSSKEDIEYLTNLWWCCYIIDRFNGLINSRCIFIKQEDFNVDLPYNNINLLKLVQLARSSENMAIAIYQPFDNSNNNFQRRDKIFNVDEFQSLEFDFCKKEKLNGNLLYEQSSIMSEEFSSKDSINAYTTRCIHFLTRIVNNIIVLFSQKAKYDNVQIPNSIPETASLEASKNILTYILQIKDEDILNIPLVPWCVSLGMAVMLKKKAKFLLRTKYKQSDVDDCELDLQSYISSLNDFSKKWWAVDEICKLAKDFVEKLNKNTILNVRNMKDGDSHKKRRKIENDSNEANNNTVSSFSSIESSNNIRQDLERGGFIIKSIDKPKPIFSILNILNENQEENKSTAVEYSNLDDMSGSYIASKSSSTPYFGGDNMPHLADQYHDFLESMHVDLFDNDFLRDFPNIVHQLMEDK